MTGSLNECPSCLEKSLKLHRLEGIIECQKCGRITEERTAELSQLFIEVYNDEDLYVVAEDLNEFSDKINEIDDDIFQTKQFISVHSEMSLDQDPTFMATARTYSGALADFERVMGDCIYQNQDVISYLCQIGRMSPPIPNDNKSTMDPKNLLISYFHILDLCNILGLGNHIKELSLKYVRTFNISSVTLRNRNIEAIASAAVVLATRTPNTGCEEYTLTLQEAAAPMNIQPKEVGKYIKLLQESLKIEMINQPSSSSVITNHMSRFCKKLQIPEKSQKLAMYIAETILNSTEYTRRNPITISAGAIYLAVTLEDLKITQSDICKTTGLTGVTLRKIYRELLNNVEQLLPRGYIPPNMIGAVVEKPKSEQYKYDTNFNKVPIPKDMKIPLTPETPNSKTISFLPTTPTLHLPIQPKLNIQPKSTQPSPKPNVHPNTQNLLPTRQGNSPVMIPVFPLDNKLPTLIQSPIPRNIPSPIVPKRQDGVQSSQIAKQIDAQNTAKPQNMIPHANILRPPLQMTPPMMIDNNQLLANPFPKGQPIQPFKKIIPKNGNTNTETKPIPKPTPTIPLIFPPVPNLTNVQYQNIFANIITPPQKRYSRIAKKEEK